MSARLPGIPGSALRAAIAAAEPCLIAVLRDRGEHPAGDAAMSSLTQFVPTSITARLVSCGEKEEASEEGFCTGFSGRSVVMKGVAEPAAPPVLFQALHHNPTQIATQEVH
jgi:hypothetical protein